MAKWARPDGPAHQPDWKSKGQAKNFSPPAHNSPARQAQWPKRVSPRPVPLTKTHNNTCLIFLLSLPHCAPSTRDQTTTLRDSSRFSSLRHTHTQTRFSSTHSPLATTKDVGHHVAAGHTFFSSTVTSTTSLPEARKQRRARRTQSYLQTLRLADDSDRHDHIQDRFVRNFRSGSLSPDL